MNRRILLIGILSPGLVLSVVALVTLTRGGGNNVTVSFVNAEPSHGQFPNYAPSERLDFVVHNAGRKPASVQVFEIKDEHGKWIPALHLLGDVDPGQSTQTCLYLPLGSHPKSLRLRVLEPASAVKKTQYALRLLIDKASGRYRGKQVWLDRLKVPAHELIVSLGNAAEPDGANASPPFGSQSNANGRALPR